MNRKADIIVVGSGMAGMSAALVAAQQGKSVTLLTHGMGTLAISSGCIDVLGYVQESSVQNPFSAMENLPDEHPYRLIGTENVRSSLEWFRSVCRKGGLSMISGTDNRELITVMGTLKPSWLCSDSFDTSALQDVHRAAVVTVEDMKDVHPGLIIDQLHRYKSYEDLELSEAVLSCPIAEVHRNITPLDIARYVETPEGFQWLKSSLIPLAKLYPVLLLPPICGMRHSQQIWNQLCTELKIKIIEMVSIPPGVAGLRLREIMKKALNHVGVCTVENAEVIRAQVEGGICRSLVTLGADGERVWEAQKFIVATGGLLSGGIDTAPGKAQEHIFGLNLNAPAQTEDWSSPDIFGKSFFAHMGVHTNNQLLPVDTDGNVLLQNVYFAGRILGGYDFAAEKSGQGVALSTGWYAGTLAGKE